MSTFDTLVEQVIAQTPEYPTLRTVIEKELLHHDILRAMNRAGFLKSLTFMGGTCLRDCHGSPRLSEDLDFTGGFDFSKNDMSELGSVIQKSIGEKYELPVTVTEPTKESGNTETWKITNTRRRASRYGVLIRYCSRIQYPLFRRRASGY